MLIYETNKIGKIIVIENIYLGLTVFEYIRNVVLAFFSNSSNYYQAEEIKKKQPVPKFG